MPGAIGAYAALHKRHWQRCAIRLDCGEPGTTGFACLEAFLDRVVSTADEPCLALGTVCEFGYQEERHNRIRAEADVVLVAGLVEVIRRASAEGGIRSDLEEFQVAAFLLAHVAAIRMAARGGAPRPALEAIRALALRALI